MITRFIIEVEHDEEPVDGVLVNKPRLIGLVLDALAETSDDDIDVRVSGVRIIEPEGEDDDG